MNKEQYIPNSRLTIFYFYLEKLLFTLPAFVTGFISYASWQKGGHEWQYLIPIALILIFIADSIALIVGRDGEELVFHHLWRTSKFQFNDFRFLWISEGGLYKMQRKGGHKLTIGIGSPPWKVVSITSDNINKMANILEPYQTHRF